MRLQSLAGRAVIGHSIRCLVVSRAETGGGSCSSTCTQKGYGQVPKALDDAQPCFCRFEKELKLLQHLRTEQEAQLKAARQEARAALEACKWLETQRSSLQRAAGLEQHETRCQLQQAQADRAQLQQRLQALEEVHAQQVSCEVQCQNH